MPFTLTVANVSGRRPEFAFDAKEARLGRTADNDIVVKDPNASRAHCRVFQKEGRYFVEDLKSANGTQVNLSVIHGTVLEVKSGDTIGIGEVQFTFTSQATPSLEIPQQDFEPSDTVVRGGAGSVDEDEPANVSATLLKPAHDPKIFDRMRERERERPTSRPERPRVKDTVTVPPLSTDELEKPPVARLDPAQLGASPDATAELEQPSGPKLVPPPPLGAVVDATDRLKAQTTLTPKVLNNPEPAASQPGSTSEVDVPPPAALVKAESAVPAPVAQPAEGDRIRVRRGGDKKPEEDSELFEPTAAQKARIRRQAHKSTAGRLLYSWSQLGVATRAVVGILALAFVLGIGGFAYVQLAPAAKVIIPPEPNELVGGGPTLEYSFGSGDGVTYERPDMKLFTFKAVSPTRLVGMLHYQARDISKEEVSISVNGFDLGYVPPDGIDSAERELEVVLPAGQVKRNEQNQLIFDNVRNPPGHEPWRVWNIWLELLALPDASPEETLMAVKEDLERAQKYYDQRDIGPESLFKAWKSYRDAWLKLESLPGHPNDLYMLSRSQQAETRRLMDHRCKMMQLEVQRVLSARNPNYDTARQVLRDMLRYFPTREHPCYGLVQSQLEQLSAQ